LGGSSEQRRLGNEIVEDEWEPGCYPTSMTVDATSLIVKDDWERGY